VGISAAYVTFADEEGADDEKEIELELTEPYLFLRHAPEGAANLARALAKVAAGGRI
jgi:hypothetical protein